MDYRGDPANDEELFIFYDTDDARPTAATLQMHRQGVFVATFDGKFRNLTRNYDGENLLWHSDGLVVVNATFRHAELWAPNGKRQLGNVTLDGLHRIDRVEFWNQGTRADSYTAVWTVEYGPQPIPEFRPPAHRNPITFGGASNRTPDLLHVSDIVVQGAVPPEELSVRFLGAGGTIVAAVGFERRIENETLSFAWLDWNRNGLVDSGDAVEYRFPRSVVEVRIFDEWADAYVFQAPAGGIVLILSLALAAGLARRRLH